MAPKGHSTRPTADRARQSLFDVLEHAAWAPPLRGARVLDLFAGSGALGLEALSRGAAFCEFVDHDAAARAAVTANLVALRLTGQARVSAADAARSQAGEPIDLAFLDPPYGEDLVGAALGALASGRLAEGAIVVVERGAGEAALASHAYTVLDDRRWGAARIAFLRPTTVARRS